MKSSLFELHTCCDKTQWTSSLNSRLEAVTYCVKICDVSVTFSFNVSDAFESGGGPLLRLTSYSMNTPR